MATFKISKDGMREIEISDIALVITLLGVAASLLGGAWLVTRNPQTLRQLAQIATAKRVRLLHDGGPLS